MYTFLIDGKGILIFRTDNAEKAKEVILNNKLKYIEEDKLQELD
jgi:hypothetical protein